MQLPLPEEAYRGVKWHAEMLDGKLCIAIHGSLDRNCNEHTAVCKYFGRHSGSYYDLLFI